MNPELATKDTIEGHSPDLAGGPNADAVRQALTESHQRCLSYLRRRLGNVDDARDVMQSFMLRAIDRADALRDVNTVRGWLSRLLATTIVDHQRSAARRRQRETVMGPEFFDTGSASGAELEVAVCACLHQLLATVKPDYAEIIQRIDLNEEPRATVAADFGLSLATLTVRLHRARSALKKRLVEMCLTCPEHGFMDCGCDTARQSELLRAAASARG
ncbi:RNA polymerase sigma factor [Cypionkella psychrotolerans]|uniref:RNA polymerase sigma factor n=1 Tax=Cypionkella psychrotolerans TaxID=1678131 RepID=UPI0006B482DB|nr:sigma-70 family RNA polymerase sigma factor [Cypionkella psychrotolerans]